MGAEAGQIGLIHFAERTSSPVDFKATTSCQLLMLVSKLPCIKRPCSAACPLYASVTRSATFRRILTCGQSGESCQCGNGSRLDTRQRTAPVDLAPCVTRRNRRGSAAPLVSRTTSATGIACCRM